MERKHPDRWGRRQRVEMEHSGEVKQQHEGQIEVSIHEFNRIMDDGLKKLKEDDTDKDG